MTRPAGTPPIGLPGLDPAWSRHVVIPQGPAWHVLERPADGPAPELTVLAVHGNPTWSYLWRRLLQIAPPTWRIIAVDQIGMGYSSRPPGVRRLADRIDDLVELTEAMGVRGRVVTVAHDWGGPVSLGWVLRQRAGHGDGGEPDRGGRDVDAVDAVDVVGVVLTNTAVHQPAGAPAPTLIRLARSGPLLSAVTAQTDLFVRGTTWVSRGVSPDVAAALRAPYRTAADRSAIRDFVADIPLESDHPSASTLDAIAEGVRSLEVPVLLAWGSDDPVFSDRYLRDLLQRMPHADVHRYERAGHLVTEDAPSAIDDIVTWIDVTCGGAGPQDASPVGTEISAVAPTPPSGRGAGSMLDALERRSQDDDVAIVDLRSRRQVSWRGLAERVRDLAQGLADAGIGPGQRVAMLVPPGPDLIAAVYACWRIGAVVVVADAGLGPGGMRRALRGAGPDHVIGIAPGLALARTIPMPGQRILVGPGPRRVLGVTTTMATVARRGNQIRGNQIRGNDDACALPPSSNGDAVVVFTSGATGPAKGVVYRHDRLLAQRDALARAYGIGSDDGLIAAFAPWAVLGPALGIPSAIPDMDLTDASTLTATRFAQAAAAVRGTIAWTSPTALRAIVSTAADLPEGLSGRAALGRLRWLLAAGAPVPVSLLESAHGLMPQARLATPYGMTEALPLTSVDLAQLHAAVGEGVLVGSPLGGVELAIAPLDDDGRAAADLTTDPGVRGEICVRASWVKDRYDRRWATQYRSAQPAGWHRTGDVGYLDPEGLLWVGGRLPHVVTTPSGPVLPVGVERVAEEVTGAELAACVGVGPAGTQAMVVVLQVAGAARRLGLADEATTHLVRTQVRERLGHEVAAVATCSQLPVDVRHRSKINRTRVARDATRLLAGSGS